MSECVSFDSTVVDVAEDVERCVSAHIGDKVVSTYVPVFAAQIIDAVLKCDPSASYVYAGDIDRDRTLFDAHKMREYSHKWDETNIACPLSHILISHITQEEVDSISQKVADGTIVEIIEVDD